MLETPSSADRRQVDDTSPYTTIHSDKFDDLPTFFAEISGVLALNSNTRTIDKFISEDGNLYNVLKNTIFLDERWMNYCQIVNRALNTYLNGYPLHFGPSISNYVSLELTRFFDYGCVFSFVFSRDVSFIASLCTAE